MERPLSQSCLKFWFSPEKGSSGGLLASVAAPEAAPVPPLEKKRKYTQRGLFKRTGGRKKNSVVGLESRGLAGGFSSNRRYSGQQERRKDWTAAEGVEICKHMDKLKTEGLSAEEFNRRVLRQFGGQAASPKASCSRVRSLQAAWKKGLSFWEARLKQTEVGKHGKQKRGAPLKRVCRKSESKGCRESGGGRKDRFKAYKAAVKNCFSLELSNGQEVALGRLVFPESPLSSPQSPLCSLGLPLSSLGLLSSLAAAHIGGAGVGTLSNR
jgi:hypothetical protein